MEISMDVFPESKSCYTTFGQISKGMKVNIQTYNRNTWLSVFIDNNQAMRSTEVLDNKWIDKENFVCMYNGVLFSSKES
jgi:hypothetical protein